jgi:polyphosphate kinase
MTPAAVTARDPRLFLNREISLLAFHRRVLAQAQDSRVPLPVHLVHQPDEFFEVRVATIATS